MKRALAALALAATLSACGGPTGLHDPAKLAAAINEQVPGVPNDPRASTTCADLGGGDFTCTYAWSDDGTVYLLDVRVTRTASWPSSAARTSTPSR